MASNNPPDCKSCDKTSLRVSADGQLVESRENYPYRMASQFVVEQLRSALGSPCPDEPGPRSVIALGGANG